MNAMINTGGSAIVDRTTRIARCAMDRFNDNVSKTALLLGIFSLTLRYRQEKYNLDGDDR